MNKQLTCNYCNKQYTYKDFRPYRKISGFCSLICRSLSHNKKVEVICPVCGKTYLKRKCVEKINKDKYCSKECYNESQRKNDTKRCEVCGKEFNRREVICYGKFWEDRKYCSLQCAGVASRGEKSHFWKGGRKELIYSSDWRESLREIIRHRDNYTCKLCGKIQSERRLSVHHIDYDKFNCDPNNLVSLCTRCHRETNFNRESWLLFFNKKIK